MSKDGEGGGKALQKMIEGKGEKAFKKLLSQTKDDRRGSTLSIIITSTGRRVETSG